MNTFNAMVIFLGAMLLVIGIFTFPVMWLWNGLMPTLFGLKTITFLQALGLGVLCRLLFASNILPKETK